MGPQMFPPGSDKDFEKTVNNILFMAVIGQLVTYAVVLSLVGGAGYLAYRYFTGG